MLELGNNYFGVTDYILLGGTLLTSLLIGLYHGYKNKHTNEELLVGGRNMNVFPVAASVMVSYTSAITIIGFPSEIYSRGSQIYTMYLVSSIGIPISAYIFVPFFYPMKLTSINEYLERRFESKWIRKLASGILIIQQLLESGVVLYAPSIVLETFLGFPMWMSVLGMGICATIYTNIGGIKAVVWTDFFQFSMMVTGVVAILWRGFSASGGIVNALDLANESGRLEFFDFKFDLFTRHNFWNFLLGTGIHSLMQPGVNQLQVQRYSGMPSVSKAKQAIIGSVPLKLLVISLSMFTGYALFAFYANCDPFTKGEIKKIDQILPYFVVHELAGIPGMMGLFTSCVFSAALSSLSSYINSLSAVTWEDFLSHRKYFRGMTPKAQTNVTRLCGVIYGVIIITLAFIAPKLGAIWSASISMAYANLGVLYGIFVMAIFMPFVNAVGAITGALTAYVLIITISIGAFINKKASESFLSLSIEGCPDKQLEGFNNFTGNQSTSIETPTLTSTDDWPWKIFQLTYLLYPVLAIFISIFVGAFVSFLTFICVPSYRTKKPLSNLVHPLIRPFTKWCTSHGQEISQPTKVELNKKQFELREETEKQL